MNRSSFLNLLSWVGPQVLVAATVFFAADSAARYQENQDLRRQSQIWTSYAMSEHLQKTEIAVAVHGAEATLTGSVGTPAERDLAEQLARSVDGIRRVDNRLAVSSRNMTRERRVKPVQHAFALVAKAQSRGTMTGKIA
jgi:hypothetical protein